MMAVREGSARDVNRDDLPTTPDKVIENGVVVPAGLQVNGKTFASHQDGLKANRERTMNRDEALRIGYPEAEVDAYFATLARRHATASEVLQQVEANMADDLDSFFVHNRPLLNACKSAFVQEVASQLETVLGNHKDTPQNGTAAKGN